jgi:antitoxin FitA
MHNACYDRWVSRPIQIREVPDDIVEALKAKAEKEHLSLAAYALRVLERDALTPTIAEVLARPPRRSAITHEQILDAIRADREAH